ncbi:MAG: hypothetical protein JRN20_15160 [Nitrososphaerota archaeon]|nr:hypothetical protein [Nitrososphaerota archaeon]
MFLGLEGLINSVALQTNDELGAIIALVIAIGIAGVTIIIISSKKKQ